jgi:hypothetical protein
MSTFGRSGSGWGHGMLRSEMLQRRISQVVNATAEQVVDKYDVTGGTIDGDVRVAGSLEVQESISVGATPTLQITSKQGQAARIETSSVDGIGFHTNGNDTRNPKLFIDKFGRVTIGDGEVDAGSLNSARLELRAIVNEAYTPNSSTLAVPLGVNMQLTNEAEVDGGGSFIVFRTSNAGGFNQVCAFGAFSSPGDSAPTFVWTRRSGNTGRSEMMRLTGDGRLGIGTTAPSEVLEVNGNIALTGGADRTIAVPSAHALNVNIDGETRLHVGAAGQIGIGTTNPDPSAALDIQSTVPRGLLLPRMTGAQADAIDSPADGLMIYVNAATGSFASIGFYARVGGTWVKMH